MKTLLASAAMLAALVGHASAQSVWQQRSQTHYGADGYDPNQAQMMQQQQLDRIEQQQRNQQMQQFTDMPAYRSRR